MIGAEYRATTLSILPIALASGAVRNLRVHFADQVFLLMERPATFCTKINTGEAIATIVLCVRGPAQGGLVGACLGCLVAHVLGMIACFGLAIARHGLKLPLADLARIAIVTALMVFAVRMMPQGASPLWLALAIAVGAAVYGMAMAALYLAVDPPHRREREGGLGEPAPEGAQHRVARRLRLQLLVEGQGRGARFMLRAAMTVADRDTS